MSPLADIVECTSTTYEELEQDFKSKYAGTVAIYHFRNPGGPFGYFGEEFFERMPESCKVISHRESQSRCVGEVAWADYQSAPGMMISM